MSRTEYSQKKHWARRNKTAGLLAFLFCLFLPPSAHAQQARHETLQEKYAARAQNVEDKNYVSFSFENDSIGTGTDRFYSSGERLSWFNVNTPVPPVIDRLADIIPTFDLNETTSTLFTLGQNIYTPEDIRIAAPQNNDHPWAAWLYGSVGLATVTDNHIDELEVTLGLVGPEAMGEQTQKFIHRHVTNSAIPKGWAHQLDFEPGLILSWARRWPQALAYEQNNLRLALEPNINLSLGNIYTYAGSGVTLTLGPHQNALQDRPPRIRPAIPGTGFFDVPDKGWSWHLFASADGRAIARNIFLDGNSFSDGPGVSKKHLVADASAGIALTFGDYRLSYALNFRSKEFDGQDDESVFGSLTLTTRF
ncbi:MAG: lipid A deacylase LpxR family protein [Rhodospirillales bacterium]|nr:lipid A deacylase LpxR family protein [Alphaproteobacteria bacterium]USO03008.1 MAG: lipid A deacylase LpxR family protein [Rhodospirillales bacterium]